MAPLRQYTYHGASPEYHHQRETMSHQLQDLEQELQKLRLKKNNQRKTMNRLESDIDCWKEEEEKESQALNARLRNLVNELRQTRQQHGQVKQEWDDMIKKRNTSKQVKRRSIDSSPRHHVGLLPTKPYVEQQGQDGTRTRLYDSKRQPAAVATPFIGNTTNSQESRQPPSSPRTHSSSPNSSSSLGAYLDDNPKKFARHYSSCASVTTQDSLFSTLSFTQFLMGLEDESCLDMHSQTQLRHVQQSNSISTKRRGSLTRGIQTVLIRLDEEKQQE